MNPKNRSYNRQAQLTWILSVAILFASCTDMDVNFQVNGEYALDGSKAPETTATPDTNTMLKVYVGDTVVFRNTSEPASNITALKWDIDGNGVVDEHFNDKNGFKTVYTKPGNIKTSLWVNNSKDPVIKWIKVEGDFDLFTELIPEIEFIEPAERITDTKERYFDFAAQVMELYASDSIVLLHNEQSIDFEFDENLGEISQRIELNRGENKIEIIAFPLGDETIYSEAAIVNYNTKVNPTNTPKKKIKKPVVKPKPVVVETEPEPEEEDIFEIEEPVDDPEPVEPLEINLANTAKAGYNSDKVGAACQSNYVSNYTFTLTPSSLIKLNDFLVFSDACGGLQIQISSSKGTLLNTTATLTKGKSQISFGFMTEEVYLDPNIKYTIALKTVPGNTNCQSPSTPKLLDTKACSPDLRKRPHLSTKFKGKAVVHDITYSY